MRFVTCRTQGSEALYRFFDDDVWQVALDVVEEKDQYVLKADLPGIKKEDIKVSLENGILNITGERKTETEDKDKVIHRVERSYGRFVRSLNVGNSIDESKIRASYKDGVLELIVPKAQAAKPKSIDVHVD